jgi:hypothetical protein
MREIILFIFTIALFLSITGCQTKLGVAGDNHKTVTAKWGELGRYAESEIGQYGVTITAKLKHEYMTKKTEFTLWDIQLAISETSFDIDLLVPSFEDKYICTPVCYQLTEYQPNLDITGNTLLTEYFTNHEFELFKFYGDLLLLNKNLSILKNENPLLLNKYLNWLAENAKSFSDFNEFSHYLNATLTPAAMAKFVNLRSVYTQERLSTFLPTPDKKWTDDNLDPPDKKWTDDNFDSPDKNWELSKFELNKANMQNEGIVMYNTGNKSLSIKKLKIGTQVCTITENYFGNLKNIDGSEYIVNIRGQAKLEIDGAIFDAPKGTILSPSSQVSFLPLDKLMSFNRDELKQCELTIN